MYKRVILMVFFWCGNCCYSITNFIYCHVTNDSNNASCNRIDICTEEQWHKTASNAHIWDRRHYVAFYAAPKILRHIFCHLHIQSTGPFMRAIKRNYLVHIAIVKIALYILTRYNAPHTVTNKNVTRCQLTVKVGIFSNEFESGLSIFSFPIIIQ